MCLNTTEIAAETKEGPMKRQASCMDIVVELLTGVSEDFSDAFASLHLLPRILMHHQSAGVAYDLKDEADGEPGLE
jgi:hypothetical protein